MEKNNNQKLFFKESETCIPIAYGLLILVKHKLNVK